MVNEQLLAYIRNQLQKGISVEEIENALLSRGWVLKDVEEGFRSLAPLTPPITSPVTSLEPSAVKPAVVFEEKRKEEAPPTVVTPVEPTPSVAAAAAQPNLAVRLAGGVDSSVGAARGPVLPRTTPTAAPSLAGEVRRRLILGILFLLVSTSALGLGWLAFSWRQTARETASPPPTPPLYQPLTPMMPPVSEASPSSSYPPYWQATEGAGRNPPASPSAQPEIDSDSDGLSDRLEMCYGTNLQDNDTDKDGWKDGEEVRNGYTPVGPGKMPEALKTKCQ